MQFGVCANPADGAWLKACGAEFVEGHVQQFLSPMADPWAPPVANDDLALPLVGYNCLYPGDFKITGPQADLAAIEAYTKRACDRAARTGSDFVVFGSGAARMVPDGWPRDKAEVQLVDAMRVAGRAADAAGITMIMEHLNEPESNILNSLPEGLEYMRRARAPGLTILVDLFHFALMKEPLSNLDGCRGLLTHVHIAEPEGRIPPGQGRTDMRPFLAKLKDLGYDRRISVECNWKDLRGELPACLDYLRREWDAA